MPRLYYLTTEPGPFVALWKAERSPGVVDIRCCRRPPGPPEWLVRVDLPRGCFLRAPRGSRRVGHAEILSRGLGTFLPQELPPEDFPCVPSVFPGPRA
jgi:hypothetical protein